MPSKAAFIMNGLGIGYIALLATLWNTGVLPANRLEFGFVVLPACVFLMMVLPQTVVALWRHLRGKLQK